MGDHERSTISSTAFDCGCVKRLRAKNVELIKYMSATTRDDVFQELPEEAAVPSGYADLNILASLKTHKPGIYLFEKKLHGTADYKLLLNIDGQATYIKGELMEEASKARFFRDPEAGEGIRYNFRKDLRLKAGPHRVAVSIPDDAIIIVKEFNLLEGRTNLLLLEPVYGRTQGKQRPGFYGQTSFTRGINRFKAFLNGRTL